MSAKGLGRIKTGFRREPESRMGTSELPLRLRSKLCAARTTWSSRMDTEHHSPSSPYSVAVLSRGVAATRRDATPQNSRFVQVFETLAAVGIEARPAIYDESFAEEVREQLLAVDGVLVWVNPIQDSRNRAGLDALLRDVAARGVWVSAHPDVILKMGTKEVLYRTRSMGWEATRRCIKPPRRCAPSCQHGSPPVRA